MLSQDLAMLNYQHFLYSDKIYSREYCENNNTKKSENWVSYFRNLINNSLSKRYLLSCEIDNNINCPISLDKINTPAKTQCGHVFEKENIIQWIKEKRSCPVCRKKLDFD